MAHDDQMPSLEALEKRIGTVKKSNDPASKPISSASQGTRIGLDLVSGVVVGTASGYALDQWLQTTPLFMLICMALGTAAGVKLMMETSAKVARMLEEEHNKE